MVLSYIFEKCPNCGKLIPIEYGYSCGFDWHIDCNPETICDLCLNKFNADVYQLFTNYEIYELDLNKKSFNFDNTLNMYDEYKKYNNNICEFFNVVR